MRWRRGGAASRLGPQGLAALVRRSLRPGPGAGVRACCRSTSALLERGQRRGAPSALRSGFPQAQHRASEAVNSARISAKERSSGNAVLGHMARLPLLLSALALCFGLWAHQLWR